MNTKGEDGKAIENNIVLEKEVSEEKEANIRARGNSYSDAGKHTVIVMGQPSLAPKKIQTKEEIIAEYEASLEAKPEVLDKDAIIAEYLAEKAKEEEAKELKDLTDEANAKEADRLKKAEDKKKK